MKRELGLGAVEHDDASVVTVGTFDGLHRGHQAIIQYLIARAHEQKGRSVVVSFFPHPRTVVRGEEVPLLTTIGERADVLEQMGLDRFIVIEFTPEFAQLSAEAFVREILVDRIGLREIVVGYDHGFGKGREGDRRLLKRLGDELGFAVDVIPPQDVGDDVVSSSRVRRVLLEEGDVAEAARMLGRPYRFTGTVVAGDGRGRGIGYPTANLTLDEPQKVVPRVGVYAVRVALPGEDAVFGGMMNVGRRPTFEGEEERVEVHLFDVERDLYGKALTVSCIRRLRDERRFESVEALVHQLDHDEQASRRVLDRHDEGEAPSAAGRGAADAS